MSQRLDKSAAVARASAALRAHDGRQVNDDLGPLEHALELIGPVVVAFSGGADSALLAYVATRVLGPERAHCITAVSASLAPEERADCAALAAEWGLRWSVVGTDELASAEYAANDLNRCYHCKSGLMDALVPVGHVESATIVLGVNLDDLGDLRPGQRAASERGARFPLVEAGLDKKRVRELSRRLGLRTWDKPAAACLASRVPHGTSVTVELLGQVARAESGLRRLGLRELRVRHYGDTARLELGLPELQRALEFREQIVASLHDAGYRYITLDLEGLRSGNLSRTEAERSLSGNTTPVTLRRVER